MFKTFYNGGDALSARFEGGAGFGEEDFSDEDEEEEEAFEDNENNNNAASGGAGMGRRFPTQEDF